MASIHYFIRRLQRDQITRLIEYLSNYKIYLITQQQPPCQGKVS